MKITKPCLQKKKNKSPQCDSSYKWKSGLDIHVKSQHVGQYKCFECRWSFKTKEKFTEHIEYMHKGYDKTTMNLIANKSESDTDDDKSYTEDTNSEKEESLSQNDTKLSCKICNKQFVQDSNLVRHIQNFHPNNGQKRKSHETMEQETK